MDSAPLIFLSFGLAAISLAVLGVAAGIKSANGGAVGKRLIQWICGLSAFLLLSGLFIHQQFFLDEPLCIAASEGNETEVKHLLSIGASPNAESKFGTALEEARVGGHEDGIRTLEAAGAKD